jgi:hypothetical protein
MKALKILLLDGLLWNKSHFGPGHSFADRFHIVVVVLLGAHEWLDDLRRYQTNRVPKSLSTRAQ